jgi:N-acyl-D-amino-acid deacylase
MLGARKEILLEFDLKIVCGTIIDGSGRAGVVGDIGVSGGKVVALGRADGNARVVIDASNRIVAPGFVDVHTHYDAQVFWDRMMTVSSWHGVTSVVMGNCGFAIAPTKPADREKIVQSLETVEGMNGESLREGLGRDSWPFESFPEYLDAVERKGSAVNLGVFAGHLPTRFYVMGDQAIERRRSGGA